MARFGKRKAPQETPPATASPRSHATGVRLPRATAARSGECGDAAASVRVRRSSVAPRVTCGLCGGLLRDATTVSECLHSFCRKCIHQKLSDEDIKCCPVCSIALGCAPLENLRADRVLQCIRSMLFPAKKRKVAETSPLHPAFDSLFSPSCTTHGEDHSAKKIDAYLMREPMNSETETEANEKLGMVNSVSPSKPRASRPDRFEHHPPPNMVIQEGQEVEEEEIGPDLFMRKPCIGMPVLSTNDEGDTSIPTIFRLLTCDISYRKSTLSVLTPLTHTTSGPSLSIIESIGTTLPLVPSSKSLDMEVEVIKETSMSHELTPGFSIPSQATTAVLMPEQIGLDTQTNSSSSVPPATTVTAATCPSHIQAPVWNKQAKEVDISTLSSAVQISVGRSNALPPIALQSKAHDAEIENRARTSDDRVEVYMHRRLALETENAKLREDLENERAEKVVAIERTEILEAGRLQRESEIGQSTARMLERVDAYKDQCQALELENATIREELENQRAEKLFAVERTRILEEERFQKESEVAQSTARMLARIEALASQNQAFELENARLREQLENARSEKIAASGKARVLEETLQEQTERLQSETKRPQEIEAAGGELLRDYHRPLKSDMFEKEKLTNLNPNNSTIQKRDAEIKQRNTVLEDQTDHVNSLLQAEKLNSRKLNEQLGKATVEKNKLMTELKACSDVLARIQGCIRSSLTTRLSRLRDVGPAMNLGHYEDLLNRIDALGQVQELLPKMVELLKIATSLSAYSPVVAIFVRLRAYHGDNYDLQRLLRHLRLNSQDYTRIRNAVDPLAAEVAKKYEV